MNWLIRHGTVKAIRQQWAGLLNTLSDPVKTIEAADINAFLLYTAKRVMHKKTVRNQLYRCAANPFMPL